MAGRLTIVGLGPAGPELITPQVTERLAAAPTVRLRTARHPAAAVVDAPSYDHVYEAADRFADVYEEIARDLLALAAVDDLVYAVPG
ncbi:MAG: SAM-dependent methyltransferase, partial [Acidimicrobiaceae bacterium]